MLSTLLFFSALLSGLIAGLFYAYSCSVNPGLGRLTDREYLRAMQSINRAILNPLFFLSFIGTLILIPVTTYVYFRFHGFDLSCIMLIAATFTYTLGVFGVTIRGNVPLNEALDRFDLTTGAARFSQWRTEFEKPWNRYHTFRTIMNVITLMIILLVLTMKY